MIQRALVVMQPYFLPYIGHFSLLRAASRWVVFDIPRFKRKTFVSRNWIANPGGGYTRLGGEITCPPEGTIAQATFVSQRRVRDNIIGTVRRWSNKSPHANQLCDFIENSLAESHFLSVPRLNAHLLLSIGRYIGIEKEVSYASDLKLKDNLFGGPGGWAPSVTRALGFSAYINPPGGQGFINPCDFKTFDANLYFHHYLGPVSHFERDGEERPASIIQQILEYGPREVSDQTKQFKLQESQCEGIA